MKTNVNNELILAADKFKGKKLISPENFKGLTIKNSFYNVGVDFDIRLNISFFENNQRLILTSHDEFELEDE